MLEINHNGARLTWVRRLRFAALAVIGQMAGTLALMFVLSLVGIISQAWPFLGSPPVVAIVLPVLTISFPILGAWLLLNHAAGEISPLAMAIGGHVLASLLFIWIATATGGDRRAVGAMLLPLIVLLPLVSIVGAFLGSYIRPTTGTKPMSRLDAES